MVKNNYVNNKTLYAVMKQYHADCHQATTEQRQVPRVPEYVGQCLMLIATRYASKPQYSGYTYKEEMIFDGIENSLKYIYNFNPEKYSNPFAYFTQIIKFAFWRRIEQENRQYYVRLKSVNDALTGIGGQSTGSINHSIGTTDLQDEFIRKYEKRLAEKKTAAKITSGGNTVTQFFPKE